MSQPNSDQNGKARFSTGGRIEMHPDSVENLGVNKKGRKVVLVNGKDQFEIVPIESNPLPNLGNGQSPIPKHTKPKIFFEDYN